MKPFWKSKTFWVGLIQLFAGLVDLITQTSGSTEVGAAMTAGGAATLAARLLGSNVSLR